MMHSRKYNRGATTTTTTKVIVCAVASLSSAYNHNAIPIICTVNAFSSPTSPLIHHQQQQQRCLTSSSTSSNTPLSSYRHRSCHSKSTLITSRSQLYSSTSRTPYTPTTITPSSSSDILSQSGYQRPLISWYPGHIGAAERLLAETLKSVDVVVEVRDSRIPKASAHPRVAEWSNGKPRVVVFTRCDVVPKASITAWKWAMERFGANKFDGRIDAQTRNQARQALLERGKYNSNSRDANNNDGVEVGGVEDFLFVDAKRGAGIHAMQRAILRAGVHVNERRSKRGLTDRSLRVGVIGFPNVGKSALINRLLGRRRARTANTPGITRTLQWMRVGADVARTTTNSNGSNRKSFELLDSPGIIPSNIPDQNDALLLAACNSIGNAAYDNQGVAAYLMEYVSNLNTRSTNANNNNNGELMSPLWRSKILERYGFDPLEAIICEDQNVGERSRNNVPSTRLPTGEDMLQMVADNTCQGDTENASRKILQDFRSGRWGPVSLQIPPPQEEDYDNNNDEFNSKYGRQQQRKSSYSHVEEDEMQMAKENMESRARDAVLTAKQRGLELPSVLDGSRMDEEEEVGEGEGRVNEDNDRESEGITMGDNSSKNVGKGMFDGW